MPLPTRSSWPELVEALTTLSLHEREIFVQMASGPSDAEISAVTFLAVRTVKDYQRRLRQKLGVRNRSQLAIVASHLRIDTSFRT